MWVCEAVFSLISVYELKSLSLLNILNKKLKAVFVVSYSYYAFFAGNVYIKTQLSGLNCLSVWTHISSPKLLNGFS